MIRLSRTCSVCALWCILSSIVLTPSLGISITLYSKPHERNTTEETTGVNSTGSLPVIKIIKNQTLTSQERHKRLLPYLNYYVAQNKTYIDPNNNQKYKRYQLYVPSSYNYQQKHFNDFSSEDHRFTPFLENNALPGPFVPMLRNQPKNIKIHYISLQRKPELETNTDYGDLYGKLWELKSKQKLHQPIQVEHYEQPQVKQSENHNYPSRYRIQPTKTVVQIYSPTNIDIPSPSTPKDYQNENNQQPIRHGPVRFEPIRNEPAVRYEPAKHEQHNIQHVRFEPIKYESIRNDPIDYLRFHPLQNDGPEGGDPVKLDRYRYEPVKVKIETERAEPVKAQSARLEPVASGPIKHEPIRVQSGVKQFVSKHVVLDIPPNAYPLLPKSRYNHRKPIFILQRRPVHHPEENVGKQVHKLFVQTRPVQNLRPYTSPIIDENYVAQKYIDTPKIHVFPTVSPLKALKVPDYPPDYYGYEPAYNGQSVTPSPVLTSTTPAYFEQNQINSEHPNSLGLILKKLQDANALPHTLTVNNIDNSIRTLVKILNSLKKQRTSLKPIVVADENEEYTSGESGSSEEDTTERANQISSPVLPETVVHAYPEDTQEGGTPGTPGVDYPALSSIPHTSFNCKTQRYKGFFGDPDTNCQVWHYCDLNGGQASFLCPNGTIFSQVALTCDWWYNVKCSSTAQLYVLNERLYKYILPFAPKFPEDYTGPLVDKYLALKFMEMEEKMKKERKGKEDSQKDTTEIDEEEQEETTIHNTEKTN